VLLCDSRDDAAVEERLLSALFHAVSTESSCLLRGLQGTRINLRQRVPVVFVDDLPPVDFVNTVSTDNVQAGQMPQNTL